MSYQKTAWQNGDVITAEKLNNIEEGIKNSGSLILNIIPGEKEDSIIDSPIKDILDAFNAGTPIYVIEEIKQSDKHYRIDRLQIQSVIYDKIDKHDQAWGQEYSMYVGFELISTDGTETHFICVTDGTHYIPEYPTDNIIAYQQVQTK